MADSMHVPFLGAVPIDPQVVTAGDSGQPFIEQFAESATAKAMQQILAPIEKLVDK